MRLSDADHAAEGQLNLAAAPRRCAFGLVGTEVAAAVKYAEGRSCYSGVPHQPAAELELLAWLDSYSFSSRFSMTMDSSFACAQQPEVKATGVLAYVARCSCCALLASRTHTYHQAARAVDKKTR